MQQNTHMQNINVQSHLSLDHIHHDPMRQYLLKCQCLFKYCLAFVRYILFILLCNISFSTLSSAQNQSLERLYQEFGKLRSELQLNGYIGNTTSPFEEIGRMRKQLADFSVTIQQFDELVRKLHGQIELIQHEINLETNNRTEENTQLKSQIAQATMQLSKLEMLVKQLQNAQPQLNISPANNNHQALDDAQQASIKNKDETGLEQTVSAPQNIPTSDAKADDKNVESAQSTDQQPINIVEQAGILGTLPIKDIKSQQVEQATKAQDLSSTTSSDLASNDPLQSSESNSQSTKQKIDSNQDYNPLAEKTTDSDAEDLYKKGFAALNQSEADQAINLFNEFLQKYPGHRLADDSALWKGEAQLSLNQLADAAETFSKAATDFPKSDKIVHILFKLGQVLFKLKLPADGCYVYRLAYEDYDDLDPRSSSLARRAFEQENCK
ncbi:MAG: tetratricopeptide repeat protein [Pseudomonadota bacterium]